jgi:hypothetical protein
MSNGVTVVSKLKPWQQTTMGKLDRAMLEMMTDIHREAVIKAPHVTGNLVGSGRINRVEEAHYQVIFGDSRVPYARRRHFENYKNPNTKFYLSEPGNQISRNFKRYLDMIR